MEIINSTNIEDAPLQNIFEALDSLSVRLQPSFTIDGVFPQIVIDDENSSIKKRFGDSHDSYMVTVSIGIVANNIIDVKSLSSELRNLIEDTRDILSRYNMDLHDIQSSSSNLSRGDKIFPVRNFTIQYVVG